MSDEMVKDRESKTNRIKTLQEDINDTYIHFRCLIDVAIKTVRDTWTDKEIERVTISRLMLYYYITKLKE